MYELLVTRYLRYCCFQGQNVTGIREDESNVHVAALTARIEQRDNAREQPSIPSRRIQPVVGIFIRGSGLFYLFFKNL